MRQIFMRRSVMRGIVAVCLLSLTCLIPQSNVHAQTGVNVETSVAPVLFSTGQASNALLCFSSISTAQQQLNDGDTFTFLFPTAIGTVTSTGTIDVFATTLTAGNFSALFTATPSQRVVVTYH